MELKKLALWLLVIGLIALIVGAVLGALTFNTVALKEKIAEKRAEFNESGAVVAGVGCGWSDKRGKWFWNMMWDD